MSRLCNIVFCRQIFCIFAVIFALSKAQPAPNNLQAAQDQHGAASPPEYGVDVSFPMHHREFSSADSIFGTTRQRFYQEFIRGCRRHYGDRAERCDGAEQDRISLNLQQPSKMQNYTSAGYGKVRLPRALTKSLQDFFEDNLHSHHDEQWAAGNTYVNHWSANTMMLSVENPRLQGGGKTLKSKLVDFARETLEAWTGQSLVFTSLYGIRVYKTGAVLAPHVDRMPLVTSAIINVAQDVDEPWPLEVIGHDGKAHNLTLLPGEMILYESHSIIHGRPFPLKGRYYANVFVHFEPVLHSYNWFESVGQEEHASRQGNFWEIVEPAMEYVSTKRQPVLPDYIQEGTEEEKMWRQLYAYQQHKEKPNTKRKDDPPPKKVKKFNAHQAASAGDLKRLKQIGREDPDALFKKDSNDWTPLHEAARSGHAPSVEYLIQQGADVNQRTNKDKGANALWWARQYFDERHPVVRLLRENGGVAQAPEIEVIL